MTRIWVVGRQLERAQTFRVKKARIISSKGRDFFDGRASVALCDEEITQ